MNLYLIRHGQKLDNDRNLDSSELTPRGFREADLLGRRLSRHGIEKIYSSDMVRAVQTATEINKYLNVEIIVRPGIREIRMGACDRNGWKYLEDHYPEFIQEFSRHLTDIPYPPDGECGDDVWRRSKTVIEEIIASGLQNVAIVTHGGVIRVLISQFLGLSQEKRFNLGVPMTNCGISIVKYDPQTIRFVIHTFNDYAHLEDIEG